jgi:acetyl esterase/lipase
MGSTIAYPLSGAIPVLKKTARILGILSLLNGIPLLFQPRTPGAINLSALRTTGAALSPLTVLTGGLGALLGLIGQDPLAILGGTLGATAGLRQIQAVSKPHHRFGIAFGPDWEARIPEGLKSRMLPARYTGLTPLAPEARWYRDVVFDTHHETGDPLLCDVWAPDDEGDRTGLGLIFLHGGAWHYGDKDFGTRVLFRHLAAQGHVVMDVAYTLAPRADLYGMLADVKRAIAWLKVNTNVRRINPERIVLAGASAGAHLALLAAYTANDKRFQPRDVEMDTSVRGVISLYGAPDLVSCYRWADRNLSGMFMPGNETMPPALESWAADYIMRPTRYLPAYGEPIPLGKAIPRLMGGEPEQCPADYALGSPVSHVTADSPSTLLMTVENDIFIDPYSNRRLYELLRGQEVKAALVEIANTEHGFDVFFPRWNPAFQSTLYDIERFLALML